MAQTNGIPAIAVTPAIAVAGVTKRYPGVLANDDVSLGLPAQAALLTAVAIG